MNLEQIIEKAYKNAKKVELEDIIKLNLDEKEYENLITAFEKLNIKILDPIYYTDNLDCFMKDSLKQYLINIGKYPLLTAEEEIELAIKIKLGDMDARDKLINSNLRLVVNVAKRYAYNDGIDFDDLIQEGNSGLFKAVDKFDAGKGFRFSTYAYWWIRQSVTRYKHNNFKLMRIPIHVVEKINKIKQYVMEFNSKNGREPSDKEIKEHFNYPDSVIDTYNTYKEDIISLDHSISEETDEPFVNYIAGNDSVESNVFSKIENKEIREIMQQNLSSREYYVLCQRFGIIDRDPKTLESIGQELGLTRERIRQIETRALRKLRKPLMPYLGDTYSKKLK